MVDLARGHVAAIDYLMSHTGSEVFNLGTGTGYSVLDMVHAFEEANGVKVPYEIAPPPPRRPAHLLRGPQEERGGAGLEGGAHPGGYVP